MRAATAAASTLPAQGGGGDGERRGNVAEQREVGGVLAPERLGRLGDVKDLHPFRDRLALAIGIGDEGAAADQDQRLQAGEPRPHLGEVRLQHAGPARMRGGEGDARGELRAPHRVAARLGEGDQRVGGRGREIVAEHDDDVVRAVSGERLGERRRVGRGAEPRRGGARRRRLVRLLAEHVHRQRQEHRPARRRAGDGEGAPQHLADVGAAPRFAGPFHRRRSERDEVAGQPRFARQVPRVLLPRGDDQRRLARLAGDQRAHRVAEPAHRVEIDEADLARSERPAVGHGDRRRFLQAEHVGDVGRVDQRVHQRHFGRAGIAEDMGDALVAQDVDQHVIGASGHGSGPFRRWRRARRTSAI